jgi:hypothetical protein
MVKQINDGTFSALGKTTSVGDAIHGNINYMLPT